MFLARHVGVAAGLVTILWAVPGASATAVLPTDSAGPPTQTLPGQPPTGVINGRVSSNADGQPVDQARVIVTSPALTEPRVALTGPDGGFRVTHLPAGRFSVEVSKSGFVTTLFGLSATGNAFAIDLLEGQETSPIDIRLPVAGVIAGRILDADGTPFEGALVDALQFRNEGGEQMLFAIGSAPTNDEGQFRIGGLPAGLYYVAAMDPAFTDVGSADGRIEYSPTYHPGVVFPDEATRVKVDAGHVSSAVEFRLEIIRPSRVRGRISANDDRPLLAGAVVMTVERGDRLSTVPVRDVTIKPDGTFEFRNVPPGRYVIRARGTTDREGMSLFGRFSFDVAGLDVANIGITLAPGAQLSGRVDFEGERQPQREVVAAVRVHAVAVDGVAFADAYSDPLGPDGDFRFRGVMPGEYVLRLEGLPDGWSLQAVSVMGREVTDTPLTFDGAQTVRNMRIVASDVTTVVSGRVVGENGRPRPDAIVVVFPADPGLWVSYSRHVRRVRPDLDGDYRIRGLPPGEYLILATDEINESDLLDAELLEWLSAPADRLTLGVGDRLSRDLPVRSLRSQTATGDLGQRATSGARPTAFGQRSVPLQPRRAGVRTEGVAGDPAARSTHPASGARAWPGEGLAGLCGTPDRRCGLLGGT